MKHQLLELINVIESGADPAAAIAAAKLALSESEKRIFNIELTFFKPSGKYYTESRITWKAVPANGNRGCYMPDVVNYIRGIWEGGGPLPGLMSSDGHRWDGYVIVDCDEGHPTLLLPPE